MINTDNYHLLFIEPDKQGQKQRPLNDWWTKATELVMDCSTLSDNSYWYRGFHTTKCGERSGNAPIYTPMGRLTNTLAPYYMKHYREHIPESEKTKIIQELMCIAGEVPTMRREEEVRREMPALRNPSRQQRISALCLLEQTQH